MNETKRKIWHNKEDMPLAKEKILAFNEYGDARINFAINMALYWPKVIKWAYISDLHSFIHSIEVPEKDDGINNLSSDLEEAAIQYCGGNKGSDARVRAAFVVGANWQEEQGEQKPDDKVEPKFKVGDFIVNDYCMGKVIELTGDAYLLDTGQGIPFSCEHNAHLWTIADAKNGDVLSDGTTIFIFKDLLSDGSVMSYCDCDTDSGESDAFCPLSVNLMCSKITPATKERRDTLFAKMHEAGYMWDSESKQLLSLKAKPSGKQKPAWSEEDELKIKEIEEAYTNYCHGYTQDTILDWLKSLKQRIGG